MCLSLHRKHRALRQQIPDGALWLPAVQMVMFWAHILKKSDLLIEAQSPTRQRLLQRLHG